MTDEELMAYADGELTPLEAKRIEAAMAGDPTLAARVARFRNVRRALRTAYDSVVSEPVPERLRALLGDVAAREPDVDAPVIDLAAARTERNARRFGPPAWAAMAASLVVGVLVGRTLLLDDNGVLTRDGLYAGAALSQALNTQLASDADGATQIGLTFRAQDGEICRTFAHQADARVVSGLACRDEARWAVRMALSEAAANSGEYRQAGAATPAILEAVDAIIDGETFDAAQERQARDAGWRE
jgi:anti-sigma factor RsiW